MAFREHSPLLPFLLPPLPAHPALPNIIRNSNNDKSCIDASLDDQKWQLSAPFNAFTSTKLFYEKAYEYIAYGTICS